MSPAATHRSVSNYTLLETVGQGTFGEVMRAVERHTRETVAVKILEKDKVTDEDARQRLVNEIQILHRVQHPNLVQMLEVVEQADAIFLVTEYVGELCTFECRAAQLACADGGAFSTIAIGGGELFKHIVDKGQLEEPEAMKLFAQMVAAVDSCHRQLVIHRDLKVRTSRLSPHLPPRPFARAKPPASQRQCPVRGSRPTHAHLHATCSRRMFF